MSMRQVWLRKVAERKARQETDEITVNAIVDAVRSHTEGIFVWSQTLEAKVTKLLARRADQHDKHGHPA